MPSRAIYEAACPDKPHSTQRGSISVFPLCQQGNDREDCWPCSNVPERPDRCLCLVIRMAANLSILHCRSLPSYTRHDMSLPRVLRNGRETDNIINPKMPCVYCSHMRV